MKEETNLGKLKEVLDYLIDNNIVLDDELSKDITDKLNQIRNE